MIDPMPGEMSALQPGFRSVLCSWGSGLPPRLGQVLCRHESVLCLVFYLGPGWRRTASGIRAELTWFERKLAFSWNGPWGQLGADEQDLSSGRRDPTSFTSPLLAFYVLIYYIRNGPAQ